MSLKDWKKTKTRRIGNNISIIYINKKEGLSLELFRDATWGNIDNMNVIVRDKNIKSYESSLGKAISVKYFGSESEAKYFAKSYMRKHK